MVTHILSQLDRPDIPNNFESATNLPAIAFKTGTSYGRRDAWAIGYSSEMTIGVWMGNPNNTGNPNLAGGKTAAPLLMDLFNSTSSKPSKVIMPQPADVQIRQVCAESGLIPGAYCSHLIDDYFSVRQTATPACSLEVGMLVSKDHRTSYCTTCIGSTPYEVVPFRNFPAELLAFWKQSGTSVAVPPPHNPACARVFDGKGPTILSPTDDMSYYLLPSQDQLTLEAASEGDVRWHYWYVDDMFLARTESGIKCFTSIAPGNRTITCVDDKGKSSTVHITIHQAL
jgi:penicillin-binding protein 1C